MSGLKTGYGHSLEAIGYDTDRWLKEHVIRALGVCVMLRDEGNDLSQADIERKLKENKTLFEDNGYHQRQLDNHKKELQDLDAASDKELKKQILKRHTDAWDQYRRMMNDYQRDFVGMKKALERVEELIAAAKKKKLSDDTVEMGALTFAKNQIEQSTPSLPTKPEDVPMSVKEWRASVKQATARMVEYHKERLEDEKKKAKHDPLISYQKYVKFIDSHPSKGN